MINYILRTFQITKLELVTEILSIVMTMLLMYVIAVLLFTLGK